MKWRSTCRLLIDVIGLAAIVMAALGLMSGRIRSYIPILIDRQLARVWPFTYVVVGDSLAALCPWKWSFGFSPVAVANLAVSGSDIRGITRQIDLADQFRPEVVLISGGLNDLINYEAPLDEIRYDFAFLLRRLSKEQKSVVTLIPYVSNGNFADRITAANKMIAELSLQRGTLVVDINPTLSVDGVRRPEMTTDGIHFSACVPYRKIFATFPVARRRKIKKRAAELIAEEFTLRDLRKAKQITQEQVAQRLSGRQVYISRLEQRADMKLSTLREYVRALGGNLQLMVTFPGHKPVKLRDIGVILDNGRNIAQKT